VKERIVLDHARERGVGVLVETGTLYGEMIDATLHRFERIWSIELSPELARRAAARFSRWPHVTIIQGDSGVELARVAAQVEEPAVFWLDGHYSGGITAKGDVETPIVAELETVLARGYDGDVVLIDDARLFGALTDYPPVSDIVSLVARLRPDRNVTVEEDVIRIVGR
jgi:hypothetical protein